MCAFAAILVPSRWGERQVTLRRPVSSYPLAAVNPYPANASVAAAFDSAIGAWAGSLNETALLVDAAGVADAAMSCGFTGIVLLHGALRAGVGGLGAWVPALTAGPSAPTYYGMLVATVTRAAAAAAVTEADRGAK